MLPPVRRKLLLRVGWSRASLWHIGPAGHFDAGVSRSASLLAASQSDGGDMQPIRRPHIPSCSFFRQGPALRRPILASRYSLAIAPGKTA